MVRYATTLATQRTRDRRRSKYAVRGYKRWIDPFPHVHGTVPEKMVYAALVARGIRFYFLNDFQYNIPEIDFFKEYQTDFRLPDQKIIIEVQGFYWHSKPAAIESDAFKFAVYEQLGWRVLAWWDFEIEEDINKLFIAAGLGGNPQRTVNTELPPVSRKKQNTSKGIITLNKKRAARRSYRKSPVRYGKRKRTSNSYTVNIR